MGNSMDLGQCRKVGVKRRRYVDAKMRGLEKSLSKARTLKEQLRITKHQLHEAHRDIDKLRKRVIELERGAWYRRLWRWVTRKG